MNKFPLMTQAVERLIQKADDEFEAKLLSEGYIDAKSTVDEINSVNDSLTEILENERKLLIAGIDGEDVEAASSLLPTLLTSDNSDELIATLFSEHFSTFMQGLTDSYMKEIDKDLAFSLFCDRTTDWIADWSEELGTLMKLNSHKKIEAVLSTALENGESIQTVIEKLVDAYEFSPMRARATAITEVLTAHRAAAQEAYRQSPAVEYKEWRHTGSHKNTPRPNHQAISGQRVKKNERYELIGVNGSTYYPMYPGDTDLPAAERVNCHCISQPVVNSDIMGLTIEERRVLQQQAIDDDNGKWEKELSAKNKARAGITI